MLSSGEGDRFETEEDHRCARVRGHGVLMLGGQRADTCATRAASIEAWR
jgi:hypothetical protein